MVFSLWACRANAKLQGLPDSFLLVSSDQTLCLAMREPRFKSGPNDKGPFGLINPADRGRFALLSDGRQIDLYTQFPSNGVYRLSGLKPVYFLDWFDGSNSVAMSADFRSLVHVRNWAVDTYRVAPGRHMPKAMEFYRDGKMVRSYVASELVENPGTDGAFHTIQWLGDYPGDSFTPWLASIPIVRGDKLEAVTAPRGLFLAAYGIRLSPGNRFVFDITTGQILSEDRPVPGRVRVIGTLTCLTTLAAGWLFFRKRQTP